MRRRLKYINYCQQCHAARCPIRLLTFSTLILLASSIFYTSVGPMRLLLGVAIISTQRQTGSEMR